MFRGYQARVAKKLGCAQSYVSMVANGERFKQDVVDAMVADANAQQAAMDRKLRRTLHKINSLRG